MGQRPELVPEKKSWTSRWLLWACLLVGAALLYTISNTDLSSERIYPHLNNWIAIPTKRSVLPPEEAKPLSWSSFLVDTSGCRIPALAPLDPAVRKFVQAVKPLGCERKGRQLVASNLTALFVVDAVLQDYNISDADQLGCCYQTFYRKQGNKPGVDNQIRYEKKCHPFKRSVTIETEFVKVICKLEGIKIYEDYHGFIPSKKVMNDASVKERRKEDDKLSILLLGIDAVSRLNFHRQMPLTLERLNQLDAVEILGYNKVGDNTFPNMVPALSGLSEDELRQECWPTDNTPFDNCSWLWDDYKDAGFVTGFGEDAPWMGIFSYLKVGFVKQPTDYYMRPYIKVAEDEIGYKKDLNAKLCVGSRMTPELVVEYTGKFVKTFQNFPSFSFFWSSSLTHDFLNYPSLGDKLYSGFLTELEQSGVLNNTVLVFLSDHGIRWGDIRQTYQGRLEERLPLLFFLFPEWFRQQYTAAVANVRRNARRLTSPFDLHETLVDLLHPDQRLTQNKLRRRTEQGLLEQPRGRSLFLPIPENRTCEQAGIAPHWCTCQESKPVPSNSSIVNRTATFLVQHLNGLLYGHHECAELQLQSVQDVQLELPREHLKAETTDQGLHDYLIVVRTSPGDGAFEATIRHRLHEDTLTVAGDVSRINPYGKQSACMDQYHLKLYCYCLT